MSFCQAEYHREYRATHPEYCERERVTRSRYRARRNVAWRAQLASKLVLAGCADCGGRAVHFHHVDPALRHKNVSDMGDYSAAMRDEELAKCVALCASCHAKRHNRAKNFRGITRWNKGVQ